MYRHIVSTFLGSFRLVIRGTASIDQSKLNVLGHKSIRTLAAGRYKKVNPRTNRDGCLATGLSALANSGTRPPPMRNLPNVRIAKLPAKIVELRHLLGPSSVSCKTNYSILQFQHEFQVKRAISFLVFQQSFLKFFETFFYLLGLS